MRLLKSGVFLLALSCCVATGGSSSVLDDEAEIWTRINLSGLQRMLVQTISRATCHVMSGIEVEWFAAEARDAADAFDVNLQALSVGGNSTTLNPEQHDDILASLNQVDRIWQSFAPAARQVMAGDTHSVPVRQLLMLDAPLADTAATVVSQIEDIHSQRLVARQSLAHTISVASRQSMLAMRMSKSFCFLTLDIQRPQMQAELQSSLNAFEQALTAMEHGDFDMQVIDPPSLAALAALSDMRSVWDDLRPTLEVAQDPSANLRSDLLTVADATSELRVLSLKMLDIYLKR